MSGNIGSSFEYDENVEGTDESFGEGDPEASDSELYEATDEDSGEVDEGVDEAYGFVSEDSGEAPDEAEPEVDEGVDEGTDEAYVSASAQLRADQDRTRRAEWARQIAADQRLEAQRAVSTQRSITDQIRSVRPGGPPQVASVGTLQGAGVVTAILPNGRRSRMRILPTLAPISSVNRLRSVVMVNERRQFAATSRNSRAIAALATTQANAVKRLTTQQVKSDKDLSKRLVEGDNRLHRRITKELGGGSGVLDKHGKRMMRLLRRQRQRSIMNSVLLATSLPIFSAYGSRKLFTTDNAILTGSLLFWLVGDELIDSFGGKSQGLRTAADVWSYGAPIANGATAFFLLDKKQHERFIGGFTSVAAAAATATIPLTKGTIGDGSVDDFKRDAHAVTAVVVEGTNSAVKAHIDNEGNLILDFTAGATKLAWIVDTQASPSVAIKTA